VGREVPFSFCIIFGQTEEDLVNNARFAQVMYNSKYQGFTPPTRPTVQTVTSEGEVAIYWNNDSESARDVVTGYSDFEGYKIYKSLDGGNTWGDPKDMIFDTDGIFAGWRPYQQFDLSASDDSLHCVYSNSFDCPENLRRGHSINGQDPYSPWFNLGSDTGFESIKFDTVINGDSLNYMYKDVNVVDGLEYTYSVISYDMGVEPPFEKKYSDAGDGNYVMKVDTNYSNPDQWANPEGYASIENSKGTTILDRNFVQVYPGIKPVEELGTVGVVPNPYRVNSGFKESEHLRQIRFTNLPEKCTIKIFTLTGEAVATINHNDEASGNTWWDMRSMNNQEVSPGLYLFYVERSCPENNDDSVNCSKGEPYIGKFAVIR